MAKGSLSLSGCEEVGEVAIAVPVLATGVLDDDVDGHVELQRFDAGHDIDQVALQRAAALQVDDGRDERHFDAREVPVHDGEIVELALVGELVGLQRIALAAGGARRVALQEDLATVRALEAFEIGLAALRNLQKAYGRQGFGRNRGLAHGTLHSERTRISLVRRRESTP